MWYLTRNISSNISSSPLISGGSCQYFHRWYKKAPTTIIYYIWDCWFHTFAKTSKQEDMKTYFNPTLLMSCIITELPTFLWLCNDLCYFVPLPVSLKLPYSCAKTCPSTVRALPLLINMDKIHRAPSLLCWLRLDRTRRGESSFWHRGRIADLELLGMVPCDTGVTHTCSACKCISACFKSIRLHKGLSSSCRGEGVEREHTSALLMIHVYR